MTRYLLLAAWQGFSLHAFEPYRRHSFEFLIQEAGNLTPRLPRLWQELSTELGRHHARTHGDQLLTPLGIFES